MKKKFKNVCNVYYIILALLLSTSVYADIAGKVYKDFNYNGVYEFDAITGAGDAVVIGVSVSAFCDDGSTPTATTNLNGDYNLVILATANKCRVEIDPVSQGLGAGALASSSASALVEIVDNGVLNHDVPTTSPATFCQADAKVAAVATPGYSGLPGSRTPPTGFGSLFEVRNPLDGEFNGDATIPTNRVTLNNAEETGAIWGLAWKKSTQDLFMASVIKRDIPLEDFAGNADPGAIYKLDNLGNLTTFVSIPNVVQTDGFTTTCTIDPGTTGMAQMQAANRDFNNAARGSEDRMVWLCYTAKQGLGDIDISEDEKTLYTVDLYNKELITIDIATTAITRTPIIHQFGADCTQASFRPWGLKVRGDKVYIGAVCENKIGGKNGVDLDFTDDIGASVIEYDTTSGVFSELARTNSLRYNRPTPGGPSHLPTLSSLYNFTDWPGNVYSRPILTDIEFTNKGDLVLAYTNLRAFNHTETGALMSDIRKMCLNTDGSFTDESTAVAPTTCASTEVVYMPGQPEEEKYYEFYTGDHFQTNSGDSAGHPETAAGALAQKPGDANISVSMIDGTGFNQPGSIAQYSNLLGSNIGVQAVLPAGVEGLVYSSKNGGMGDIELMCDPAPIEIGNYIWNDLNNDGIQDADEPAMVGVTVNLYDSMNTLIGTDVTDSNGHYYFGGGTDANLVLGNSLIPETAYELRVNLTDPNIGGGSPTVIDVSANGEDQRDNDGDNGVLHVGFSTIAITTTAFGENLQTLDFGFVAPLMSVGNVVWLDDGTGGGTANDGIKNGTEAGIGSVDIELYLSGQTPGVDAPIKTQVTNPDGTYIFNDLVARDYFIHVPLTEFGAGQPLNGYNSSTGQSNTTDDDDVDENGDDDESDGVSSQVFTLQDNGEPVAESGFSGTAASTQDDNNTNLTIDFGFLNIPLFTLGDYVWYDANQDGIQGASETGVNGVTATLFSDANCTAGNEVGMPVVTANGGMPAADGWYEFTGLIAGDYCVEFSGIPVGYSVSPTGAGTATTDSDATVTADPTVAQIQSIALSADDPDEDMGIFIQGSVSGLVWCESGTNPNTTYDVGDADSLQSNITVNLYDDANCNNVIDGTDSASVITQSTVGGNYSFGNLITGGPGAGNNPPGCYIVNFDTADTDLGVCNHPITATQLFPTIDAVNPNNSNNDFGLDEQLNLGDYVWYDNNQNGIQDVGEPGVNGVTVELFTNASCTAPSSQMTTTANGGMPAADGWYEFTPLPSGDYCIQFTGLVAGWVITSQNQGVDDAVDSDVDIATGQIQNISLSANDLTNDMGVFAPIGNIPGQVYCDVNLNLTYDAGEEQSGIAVTLLRDSDCDGTGDITLTTLDTDGTGSFDFINLPVGLSPIPPNPAACYVLNYDLVDTDLTGCSQPFLPVTSVVELSTDIPSAPAVEFGNHVGPPMKIPVNKLWALLALSLMIFMVGRRYKQS